MTTSDADGERDRLVVWFASSFRDTSRTARSLWSTRDLLNGGLTAGQSSGNRVFVAFALKYELRAGLPEDLERFVEDHLTTGWVEQASSLRHAHGSISALVDHLHDHGELLVRLQYGNSELVSDAMGLAGEAARSLQDVIDACTAALVEGRR